MAREQAMSDNSDPRKEGLPEEGNTAKAMRGALQVAGGAVPYVGGGPISHRWGLVGTGTGQSESLFRAVGQDARRRDSRKRSDNH